MNEDTIMSHPGWGPAIIYSVLGVILYLGHSQSDRGKSGLFKSIAWSVFLSLSIAGIFLFALAMASVSLAITPFIVVPILLVCVMLGVRNGIDEFYHKQLDEELPSTNGLTDEKEISDTKLALVKSNHYSPRNIFMSGMLGFTIGTVAAFAIAVFGVWVSFLFKGPNILRGVPGRGGHSVVNIPDFVQVTAGLAILMMGWVLGGMMIKTHKPWGLPLGLIVGTTFFGILYCCWT